jgi:hypothetical protein
MLPLPQWLARRALRIPRYKKSDDPVTQKQLDTLEKFKGGLTRHDEGMVFG